MTYPVTAAQDSNRTGFAPLVSDSLRQASSDGPAVHSGQRTSSIVPPAVAEEGGAVQMASDAVEMPHPETLPLTQRPAAVLRIAIQRFPQADSWVVFYRELLGAQGLVRRTFPTPEQLHYWEGTPEFAEVLEMLTALRSTESSKSEAAEPQRMITVRIPLSLHESLKRESEDHRTSINKLCISKLLCGIASRFVPIEKGKIRGRKPGPQTGRGMFAADAPAE